MCLVRRDGKPDRLMMTGLMFLVLANVAQLIFRHMPSLNEDLIDGLRGLLFGIAIATMLLGIWRTAHVRR